MVKVTFRHQSGVYWAVCGNVSYIKGSGYLLDSIEDWKIIFVEEA